MAEINHLKNQRTDDFLYKGLSFVNLEESALARSKLTNSQSHNSTSLANSTKLGK